VLIGLLSLCFFDADHLPSSLFTVFFIFSGENVRDSSKEILDSNEAGADEEEVEG
jgi:hypothetical protein